MISCYINGAEIVITYLVIIPNLHLAGEKLWDTLAIGIIHYTYLALIFMLWCMLYSVKGFLI